MTVIFQLFCVDDLKMLRQEGREHLREIIKEVLEKDRTYQRPDKPHLEICLEASNRAEFVTAGNTPQQVVDALNRRRDRVSEQLQSPLPGTPSGLAALDPSRPIVAAARPRELEQHEEDQISQWAISCEVNNFNFYYPLLLIKEMAYTMFAEKTGKRPRGPDSPYSPFNERHPLYELFNNLKLIDEHHPLYNYFNSLKARPTSTESAGDTSS